VVDQKITPTKKNGSVKTARGKAPAQRWDADGKHTPCAGGEKEENGRGKEHDGDGGGRKDWKTRVEGTQR